MNIIQYKGIATSTIGREWLTTNIFLYKDMSCKMQVISYVSKERQKDNIVKGFTEANGIYKKINDTIRVKLNDDFFERKYLLRKGKVYPLINEDAIKTDGKWMLKR